MLRVRLQLHNRDSGHTLLTTIVVTALIAICLACYLGILSSQNQMAVRSQMWNDCIPVAEAGVEEALTHMFNDYVTNMTANGWSLVNGEYVKTNGLVLKDKPAGRLGDGWYVA